MNVSCESSLTEMDLKCIYKCYQENNDGETYPLFNFSRKEFAKLMSEG